jgi:type II secretory pathway component PulK
MRTQARGFAKPTCESPRTSVSRPRARARARARQRGVVIIVALVVLVAVTFLALTLAREARVELQVAARSADEVKTRALVDSAVERGIAELRADLDANIPDTLYANWRDDEPDFRAAQLPGGKFWFSFGEEDPGDGKIFRYGIRDEASKLNVTTATLDQLNALPGMTEDIAESILDWQSSGETPRASGAKSSYYNALTPGYNCKDSPLESLEEMLKIRGIDESVLYGEDRNRNGWLDPGEDDGDRSFPPDDANGILQYGLADYLTVCSQDLNWTKDNRKRLNLKGGPFAVGARLAQQGMSQALAREVATYIATSRRPINSVGQLVNVQGMDEANFAICADELTSSDSDWIPGRINVNTASKEVLAGLPGLTADEVTAIMSARANSAQDLTSPAWLLRVLQKQKVAGIFDFVTTRSWQFTIHAAVALDDHPSVIKRVEVVVDRGYIPAKILWRRDLTPLGFPIPGERGTNPGDPP